MNKQSFHHIPVLLDETIENLRISPGKKYIDATIGGGGHAEEIVKRGGEVLGIDQDTEAAEFAQQRLQGRVTIAQDNFENIKKIARKYNFENVDGILLDIGVSSHQIDTPDRGFSYRLDALLDMRMDVRTEKGAGDVINKYTEENLAEVLLKYGELDRGAQIARTIVKERKKAPIETTGQLVQAIEHDLGTLPPTVLSQVFQAIRIEVNDEIEKLRRVLPDSVEILKAGGRLCIITFHSLEDRAVKEFGRKKEKMNDVKIITKKPITATPGEIRKNRRSKSAKLRVIEKI